MPEQSIVELRLLEQHRERLRSGDVFGLYGLSGAADLRRLPLLRAGLVSISVIYVFRTSPHGTPCSPT